MPRPDDGARRDMFLDAKIHILNKKIDEAQRRQETCPMIECYKYEQEEEVAVLTRNAYQSMKDSVSYIAVASCCILDFVQLCTWTTVKRREGFGGFWCGNKECESRSLENKGGDWIQYVADREMNVEIQRCSMCPEENFHTYMKKVALKVAKRKPMVYIFDTDYLQGNEEMRQRLRLTPHVKDTCTLHFPEYEPQYATTALLQDDFDMFETHNRDAVTYTSCSWSETPYKF